MSWRKLVEYDWPGNVRELENVIERAMILSSGSTLVLEEPFRKMRKRTPKTHAIGHSPLDRAEITRVLEACGWKIKGVGNAAEQLGLKPSTLRYRMKCLGIQRPGAVELAGQPSRQSQQPVAAHPQGLHAAAPNRHVRPRPR